MLFSWHWYCNRFGQVIFHELGLEAQQNSPIETKGVDNFVAESDFGVPFPKFDIIPHYFGPEVLCSSAATVQRRIG